MAKSRKVSSIEPIELSFKKDVNKRHEKAVNAFNAAIKGKQKFMTKDAITVDELENSALKGSGIGPGSYSLKLNVGTKIDLEDDKKVNAVKEGFIAYIRSFFGFSDHWIIADRDFQIFAKNNKSEDVYCRILLKESKDLCRDVILSVSNKKLDIANSRLKKVIEAKIKAKVAQFK